MRRTLSLFLLSTVAVLVFATEAAAIGQQSFRIRAGVFQPDGESSYWLDANDVFFGSIDDFEDATVGIDYVVAITPMLDFILSSDYYGTEVAQAYRDFEDANGFDIVHDTLLDVTPITVGLIVNLAPPRAPVRFFVGAGAGVYLWQLEEVGDFIDFDAQPLDIFFDSFIDDGAEFGYYLQAGLEVPFSRQLSFVADARWDDVEADLSGDFRGFGELDLSGVRYTAGIGWSF